MEKRQQQVVESYQRVRGFAGEHPAKGTLSYTSALAMLDDVLEKVRSLASMEYRGREVGRAEKRRQADQLRLLVDEHIRPIVTIARAQIEPQSDVGLPAGLRMPALPLNPSKAVTVCDGMLEAARPHEVLFVANGLPADFLEQFANARNELERLTGGHTTQVGAHKAARSLLPVQLVRGRRAVERLDAIVRASYRRDPGVLAAWRSAKRVQKTPGGAGSRVESDETPVAETPALPQAA
ncbi:MAG: hypothetical protein IT357_04050 [Gemmatimonadaceae bacterium]|nr:hypothetical protein [Gemmatimonadaceae bacterium]